MRRGLAVSITLQSTVGGFSAEFMRKLPLVEKAMIAHGLEPSQFVISKDRATPPTVPIIGPFIGVIPPVLIAFTISPAYPLLVLVILLVIQLIDANTVVPLVMNRVVALPALAVVLALLIGGTLQGLIGALLAVPIAAAIQVVTLRVLVPAVHRSQGRPDAIHAEHRPVAATAEATAPRRTGRRVLPRLRRS